MNGALRQFWWATCPKIVMAYHCVECYKLRSVMSVCCHCPCSRPYAEQGLFICQSSMCLSHPSAVAGLLLWAQMAGDFDLLLHGRLANAGSATLSAYVVAEHRLVRSCIMSFGGWS